MAVEADMGVGAILIGWGPTAAVAGRVCGVKG
ncbi:hypothetical protein V473_02165 [Sphingobium cupriresistens LL01]|uniref:Uncharacterized protein n=1 Tax=Sphingobium cupriresistens LL01 TaxID=1420583 RepID=A0A0J7Y4A0_9SPHN|nr:hypothetical protein V473_02165 [Sphingobium cupriresistens LL01]